MTIGTLFGKINKRPELNKRPFGHFLAKLINDLSLIRPTICTKFRKINKRPWSFIRDSRVLKTAFNFTVSQRTLRQEGRKHSVFKEMVRRKYKFFQKIKTFPK